MDARSGIDAFLKRGMVVLLWATLVMLCVTLLSHAYLGFRIATLVYQGQQLTAEVHGEIQRLETRIAEMDDRARQARDEAVDKALDRLVASRLGQTLMEEPDQGSDGLNLQDAASEHLRDAAVREGVKLLTSEQTRDWLRQRVRARTTQPAPAEASPEATPANP